jgi:hypothetical protein
MKNDSFSTVRCVFNLEKADELKIMPRRKRGVTGIEGDPDNLGQICFSRVAL